MILVPEPLTEATFAPFGRVIAPGDGRLVNEGRATRTDLARLGFREGRPVLASYHIEASRFPIAIRTLERHPASEQAFVPDDDAACLVVVAPAVDGGRPDRAGARAFIPAPGTPFLYRAGTWHAPLFALGGACRFLMMISELGTAADGETVAVDPAWMVEAPASRAGR